MLLLLQGASIDLAGFLHCIVHIAFWKYVASGSERTLPRAVSLVLESVTAAFQVRLFHRKHPDINVQFRLTRCS